MPTVNELEAMFADLLSKLNDLARVLLHAQDEAEIKTAFLVAGKSVIESFQEEESQMERTGCPALEVNRAGHEKFTQQLSNLYAQVVAEHSGVRASGTLKRELIPWLQEHHALVDRQLVHHLRRMETASAAVLRDAPV